MRVAMVLPLLAALTPTPTPAGAQKHYTDLVFPPLRELQVPEVERVELPNGLALYLLEDHQLPKVEGIALVRTGSRFEPADKIGLASILGQVLRTGGSTSRPGEEIDRALEDVGAVVETDIGIGSGRASVFALREHLPLVLEILAEILTSPALPEDRIELAKVQERTGVARRNDDVNAIASREFGKLLYGSESPYARTTEYGTLSKIARDDLVAFHRRYFLPNRTLLGLWGDFDKKEVRALVERVFGKWQRGPESDEPLPEIASSGERSVNLVSKEDVNQSQIRVGHLGGRVDDPDYYALTVMSEILGGGFSSRLFQTVRSQRGLAYRVSASWSAAYDHPGSFVVASATKSESTIETIRAILEEIERMTRDPVSEDELALAEDGILNSFVFNFDSKGEIVSRMMNYDYFGYPHDFLSTYQAKIAAVTAGDVLRAAKAHVHPDALVILAVGNDHDFEAPLASLGTVRALDISIAPAAASALAEAPAADPESLRRGAETLSRFVASAGEAAKMKGFLLRGESTVVTPQGPMSVQLEVQFAAPDRYREKNTLPFGEIVTVLNGEAAWGSTPRGVQDLDADQKRRARDGIYRHYLGLLWAAAAGKVEAQFLVSSGEANQVLLKVEGLSMKGSFDASTGRLLELSLPGTSLQGAPVEETRKFSSFESSAGGAFPSRIEILHDGAPAAETRLERATLDPPVEDDLFSRPQTR
jgi:zinc protease